MKISSATLIAFAAGAIGAPSTVKPRQAPGGCSSAVKLDAKTNVWTSYTLHPNAFYRSEVEAAAAQMSGADAEAALKVADVGTFLWAYVIPEPASSPVPCENSLANAVIEILSPTLRVLNLRFRMCLVTISSVLSSTTFLVVTVPRRLPMESFPLVQSTGTRPSTSTVRLTFFY